MRAFFGYVFTHALFVVSLSDLNVGCRWEIIRVDDGDDAYPADIAQADPGYLRTRHDDILSRKNTEGRTEEQKMHWRGLLLQETGLCGALIPGVRMDDVRLVNTRKIPAWHGLTGALIIPSRGNLGLPNNL